MYQLAGNEFGELVKREFTTNLMTAESSGSLKNVFSCRSQSLRTANFDVLKFTAAFQEETRVNNFQDATHVSMHFQLSGKSGASISGLGNTQPMQRGQFNLLNCVDPVSSFVFPRQTQYEYICVGLKPSFFNEVLEECGNTYNEVLVQSIKKEAFTLFTSGVTTNHYQLAALQLLQKPPLADSLKAAYTTSKVKELILLSLNLYSNTNNHKQAAVPIADVEKLHAVKEFLTEKYLTDLSLEGISRAFLLNEFKLKKGFKALFNSTIFEYIHQLRMQHAHTLLASGSFSIGETAAITGYTSDSSFIRAFRLFYGHSPGKMFGLVNYA